MNTGWRWVFDKVLGCVEYVGEIVATFLGLNESKYQYVMDQMTEEDWRIAREIHAKRECQDSLRQPLTPDAVEVHLMESQQLVE